MRFKMKSQRKQVVTEWEKTPEYREAVMLKVIRAMKNYGYSDWMRSELKSLGISI